MTRVFYRDINLNFVANPKTGDIGAFTNESAINRSIKNLVLTNVFERFFDPRKAGGVKEMLFDFNNPLTRASLIRRIRDVIVNYEPRADLLDVSVSDADENHISVSIKYYTNISTEPAKFTFLVKRVL